MKAIYVALAALFLAPAAPAFADELRGGAGVIELYSEPNFNGDRRLFTSESWNLSQFGFNDVARSARVRGGAWEVCQHQSFGGTCRTLTRDIADLEQLGLARQITSLRPAAAWGRDDDDWDDRGGGRGEIEFFEGEGFSGRRVRLSFEESDFRRLNFNDAPRSLRTRGAWIVCEHALFAGTCRTVRGEVYDLRAIGLWGAISSARPVGAGGDDHDGGWERGPVSEGRTAAFFPRPRRHGEDLPACAPGRYGEARPGAGRGCVQATADAFCRAQGYRASQYYSVRWGRRGDVLDDVLCVR